MCVIWHSGRGICVERYMISVREYFGNQFTTAVICVWVPECVFTSPVIIEFGMLVMYCMQFGMSVSVVSMVSCYGVSWCYAYVGHVVVFLGAMHMLAIVMSLKCFVCILRSCISVLSVLMTCGVLMCVHVVSDLMYVMWPPPCLCLLSVRMAVKCGICGVLNAEVSFDYCIVMMSGCGMCMRCLSSYTVLLIPFA